MFSSNEALWSPRFQFKKFIDFCIWVLELDGLHVPPFDLHPQGNMSLQARGLDPLTWQAWVQKVVILQDIRLQRFITLQPKQDSVKQDIETINSAVSSANLKTVLTGLSTSLEAEWDREEQRYQQAISQIGELPVDLQNYSPLDLWMGESAVKELLEELWQQYSQVSGQRGRQMRESEQRVIVPGSLSNQKIHKLWEDLQPYQAHLAGLMVYQVNYPAPVEYLIPPVSVVLSFQNGLLDSDKFHDYVLRAAQKLAETASSA